MNIEMTDRNNTPFITGKFQLTLIIDNQRKGYCPTSHDFNRPGHISKRNQLDFGLSQPVRQVIIHIDNHDIFFETASRNRIMNESSVLFARRHERNQTL